MSRSRLDRLVVAVFVLVGFGALAVVLTWPLALHLTTDLPGDPRGDTGVYVWNLWIFRHELLDHAHLPFTTRHVFALTGGADFSLHNYTPIAGLLGVPLIPQLGVVGAFNVVLMVVLSLSGAAVYGLARYTGLRPASAGLAGALFMAAPLISARETAHLSLVTNAALPLFLWALFRVLDHPTRVGAALVGTAVAVATYSDAYYGIFAVIMGCFVLAWRYLRLESVTPSTPGQVRTRWLDTVLGVALAAAILPSLASLSELRVGSLVLRGLDRPFTPLLIVVGLGCLRLWITRRPSLHVVSATERPARLFELGLVAVGVCLLLLSPLLVGIGQRYWQGRLPDTHIYWRSSPRGVDLLAYVVPNPTHAWVGRWTERWLLPDVQDAFPELVASFSIVAIAAVGFAVARREVPRMWVAFTGLFVLLSLGPFIHVGGINTFVVGPWALLRYVPLVGMARSPSRFAIVAALGLSMLCASAVQTWLDQRRSRTVGVLLLVCLMAVEMVPGPRRLFSAAVPDVYQLVTTSDDEGGRLLELPAGIRDGTSSIGNFTASTAYFQTSHRRPLIGGYLSRVSEWRKRESLRSPMLRALYLLSTPDGTLDAELARTARDSRDEFLNRSCIRYVLVDKGRASESLRAFAREALNLTTLHEDAGYELFTPLGAPACESSGVEHATSSQRFARQP